VADPGNRERAGEQVAVRLDQRQHQDDEAPERQEVRDPWNRPLEQLALPEHLGGLRFGVTGGVRADGFDPLGRRLPGPAQPVEPPQPTPGHRGRDRGQGESDDDAQDQGDLRGAGWPAGG
jgi:hypothetical protein